jgi:hypothetical protein
MSTAPGRAKQLKKMRLEYAKQTLGPITLSAEQRFRSMARRPPNCSHLRINVSTKSKSRGRDVTVSMQGRHFQGLH